MRSVFLPVSFIFIIFVQCETESAFFTDQMTDGFCMKVNDDHIINRYDIDYYDYSTHIVYLKSSDTILNQPFEPLEFTVYADFQEIYRGSTLPLYSCAMVFGPTINPFYPDFVISIGNNFIYDSTGHASPDPRDDERIIAALSRYNQFHCGLRCTIDTIVKTPGSLSLAFTIINDDSFNYYIFSPDKMGKRLFHYFTNGLIIIDYINHQSYGHHIESQNPDPYDSWDEGWLDLLRHNKKKSYNLFYDQFDDIPDGQYNAHFHFPGLRYGVDNKEDIIGDNGRIWLGEINTRKEITIN